MKEVIKQFFEDFDTINIIIGAIFGGIVTYITTAIKDRRDRRVEYEKTIGSKIADSLYTIREITQQANVQEIYDLEDENGIKGDVSLSGHKIYPAILNDGESILDFFTIINESRIKHEIYLSYKLSAYLLYMTNYVIELSKFIGQFDSVDYKLLGVFIMPDIRMWQRDIDKKIVKEINKNNLKLVSKTGFVWENSKKRINDKYWNKSKLKELIESDLSTFDEVAEYCLTKA
ncbi:hypothetical protein [Desemzia sp. FAM 23989]|uniref:hypothetical protein n=1 Tax=Desemzia sp. FAM 23989 TaxID=3259523 RepID=UPI0038847AFE